MREAALSLFAQRGYRSTGIRDIADALGIGTTSVYSHISSKAELLSEIVFATLEANLQAQAAVIAGSDDPVEQLRRVAESLVRDFVRHPREGIITTRDFVWLEGPDRERALALRHRYRERIQALLLARAGAKSYDAAAAKIAAFAVIEMCEAVPLWFNPEGELSEAQVAYLYGEFAVAIARARGV